mmetsp:Transcript_31780/g.62928  ORF Transcript_31780/g.62928 Transcript_31780/m.62928 type:complete len:103 (-) Transcript_31780:560-868(-)
MSVCVCTYLCGLCVDAVLQDSEIDGRDLPDPFLSSLLQGSSLDVSLVDRRHTRERERACKKRQRELGRETERGRAFCACNRRELEEIGRSPGNKNCAQKDAQ